MPALFSTPIFQALDDNGSPLSGAKLYFYEAGTTTPRDVYSDTGLSTAISQPVVADSAGRFEDIYMAADDYKAVLQNSASVEVWTQDNYTPAAPGSTNLLNGVTTAAAARTAIGAASATDVSANTTSLASISSEITSAGGTLRALAGVAALETSHLATGFGVVTRQRVRVENSNSTSLGAIPADGSVPQNTEGTEVFNETITPKSANSVIFVRGILNMRAVSGRYVATIFFAGASSASRTWLYSPDTNQDTGVPFEAQYEPGNTNALEIMVRAGATGSSTLNHTNLYGGSSVSSLEILELETF